MKLFCDCKTDSEKSDFFLSGRGYESGVIATAIQNDVAMAYSRCVSFAEEITTMREKLRVAEDALEIASDKKRVFIYPDRIDIAAAALAKIREE